MNQSLRHSFATHLLEMSMSMYDDQKTYFDGLIKFIQDVDQGRF